MCNRVFRVVVCDQDEECGYCNFVENGEECVDVEHVVVD